MTEADVALTDFALALECALWLLGLAAVGIVALAGWGIGAQLAVYLSLLVSGRQSFLVAIVQYLPAALFLLWAIVSRARRADLPGAVPAALGLALMLAAAPVQQARIDLLALGLTYNSVYHVVQGLRFALFFAGARRWVTALAKTLPDPAGPRLGRSWTYDVRHVVLFGVNPIGTTAITTDRVPLQ